MSVRRLDRIIDRNTERSQREVEQRVIAHRHANALEKIGEALIRIAAALEQRT